MLYKKLFIFFFVLLGTNLIMAGESRHHQKVDGMNMVVNHGKVSLMPAFKLVLNH